MSSSSSDIQNMEKWLKMFTICKETLNESLIERLLKEIDENQFSEKSSEKENRRKLIINLMKLK
jgi:site-specific recombinase XerD